MNLRGMGAMARVTLSEVLRQKLLYNVLAAGFFLMVLVLLAARISGNLGSRIATDFSMSALDLATALTAVLVCSTVIAREIERRTILVVLSRPISRAEFVFGKWLGVAFVILIDWALLLLVSAGVVTWVSGGLPGPIYFLAGLLILLQALLMGALSLALSSFTTPGLAVVMAVGLYLLGNSISQIRALAVNSDGIWREVLTAASHALPNLEHFKVGTHLTYGMPLPDGYFLTAALYGTVCIIGLVGLASVLIGRKEI